MLARGGLRATPSCSFVVGDLTTPADGKGRPSTLRPPVPDLPQIPGITLPAPLTDAPSEPCPSELYTATDRRAVFSPTRGRSAPAPHGGLPYGQVCVDGSV